MLKTRQLIVTNGLSYYDSGPGMRSGIRVIGVVYVVVGNGAVSSTGAMRFTDEQQYMYIVMFEKEFNLAKECNLRTTIDVFSHCVLIWYKDLP